MMPMIFGTLGTSLPLLGRDLKSLTAGRETTAQERGGEENRREG